MTSLGRCVLENGYLDAKKICFDERKLVLAYEELSELPEDIIAKFADWIEILDLSHNHISEPQFLAKFSSLTTLIMDHNEMASESELPPLPNLHTLWINSNRIAELSTFVGKLARSVPNLRNLSMMKNPAAPCTFGSGSFSQYATYRYFVISYFPRLEHLDDQKVTPIERHEATKHFNNLKVLQFLLPNTPRFPFVRENKIV